MASVYVTLALRRSVDVGADRQFVDRASERPRFANKCWGVPRLIVFVVEQNTATQSHTLIHLRPWLSHGSVLLSPNIHEDHGSTPETKYQLKGHTQ
jgi:hypothetical protein